MAALVGNLTSVWNPFDCTLLFARQPEPDLEFTEEELDQTIATKARNPLNSPQETRWGKPDPLDTTLSSCRRYCLCFDGTGDDYRMAESLPW